MPSLSLWIATTLAVIALYISLFAFVEYLLNPLQDIVFPGLSTVLSLVFLPHGIRVLATVVLGFKAVPALVLASIISTFFFFGITDINVLFVISLISGLVPWVVLKGLQSLDVNVFYLSRSQEMPSFKTILLGGLLCSVANGILTMAVFEGYLDINHTITAVVGYIVGDTIGLIATWLAAYYLIGKVPAFKYTDN